MHGGRGDPVTARLLLLRSMKHTSPHFSWPSKRKAKGKPPGRCPVCKDVGVTHMLDTRAFDHIIGEWMNCVALRHGTGPACGRICHLKGATVKDLE